MEVLGKSITFFQRLSPRKSKEAATPSSAAQASQASAQRKAEHYRDTNTNANANFNKTPCLR
jgi:hypothetical protein